jgi:hypothetical protein
MIKKAEWADGLRLGGHPSWRVKVHAPACRGERVRSARKEPGNHTCQDVARSRGRQTDVSRATTPTGATSRSNIALPKVATIACRKWRHSWCGGRQR